MSVYFIDLEAFQDNDCCYVIKELCTINVNSIFKPWHCVVKLAPTEWSHLSEKARKTNWYLTNHRHQLYWCEGNSKGICAECIVDSIQPARDALFYVKDNIKGNKITLLQSLFPMLHQGQYL